MSEYDYVTCGPREVRAITGPPTYDITPKLSGEPIDYACTETRRRANAIFLHTSKEPEIEKSRKKSIESFNPSKTFPCLKYFDKHIGKKSNTSPKQPKQTKESLVQSRTSPRQIMSIPSLIKSKSVEDLEESFPSQLTPLQVPLNTADSDSLKSKSSSMNFLHMISKPVTTASPLANNDNSESSHTRPLPFLPPSSNSPPLVGENIYEELDEPMKKEILQESNFTYVVFQSGSEKKMRTEERFKVDTRPPAPLPHLTRGGNQPNTSPKQIHSLTRDNNKPMPPQKPVQITYKPTENILNDTRAKKHPPVPEKPVIIKKTSKEEQTRDSLNPVMDNSRKPFSDTPTTISSLTHQSSLKFTIPINLASSIPLYSLQRSQDITSEIQTVTDMFVNDFSDGDFTDDEESMLFNFKTASTDTKGFVMETSLSLVESTDYATYDRILKDINKFSKQATLAPSKDVEYVTYDSFINLTRSHSADLDGYVTTEMLRGNQAKSSLPNADTSQVEYINTQHTQSKIVQSRNSPNRPNKMPKPQPRNAPKPNPRTKPIINIKSSFGNNVPTHNIIARTASYEDPGYVGEDTACLQPGREDLVQSYHEYADSQIMDSVPISCDGSFPGQQFFKSSRRRKSILKQSRSRKSREPSIYTNYMDTSQLLRTSQKHNYAEDRVEYDYVYPIELRIPFRVSWAPLFFNDDFSYVPNMEVAKLLSALNVTNHINQGWDFDQYSTVVNSKAAVRRPPPIYPKTDSLLRENNKRFMPFRPSLNCTPEDENIVSIAKRNRNPLLSRSNRLSFRASFPIVSNTSTNSMDSVFEDHLCGVSIMSSIHSINKRGKFPSKPMLPPSKEQPELKSSMPVTTSGRVDERGESIPRSLSASKIELAPSEGSETEVQSHTLNRYHQKQKKLRQNPTDSDNTAKKEIQNQSSLDQENAVFTKLSARPSLKREKFMMSFSTTILLQEENVIQIPSSAVSLKINITDTSYIAKEIEFVIQIFTNYSYWENKLDTSRKAWFREKSVNLSPIVNISCKTNPPPNFGTMLLTIPICGQLGGWVYHLYQKDVDYLYGSDRKDSYEYKLCDDRVEISTSLFGYYCIKGDCTEKKQVCIKKVVFIAFRGLFNQNKILIGMSNDTPDDIKLYKEEMHDRHYRAIQREPCPYLLSNTTAQPPLRISLKIDGKTEPREMEIPFMTAWKMVPNSLSAEDAPPTPSCVFTLPSPPHKIDFTVRHGHKYVHYALNT